MKKALLLTSLSGLISFIFTAPTLANISLTLPESAEILVVNGKKQLQKNN